MDIDELTDFIIQKITNIGIDYRPYNFDNQKAVISSVTKIGGYNPNTATPFNHAHEYIHALYNDEVRECECDTLSTAEKRANKEGILLLWELFKDNDGTDDDIVLFCDLSGCPFDSAFRLLKSLNINEKFDSIDDCARDYMSYFDVIMPDTINVYNFLDCYGLPYTDYYNALDVLNKACGFELAS